MKHYQKGRESESIKLFCINIHFTINPFTFNNYWIWKLLYWLIVLFYTICKKRTTMCLSEQIYRTSQCIHTYIEPIQSILMQITDGLVLNTVQYIILWFSKLKISLFMRPFEEEGVYCFANVGRSVGMSVGRPNDFR